MMPTMSTDRIRQWTRGKPTVSELLTDSVCQMMMSSDGVAAEMVTALVEQWRSWQRVDAARA
jgi:hypothetical protein